MRAATIRCPFLTSAALLLLVCLLPAQVSANPVPAGACCFPDGTCQMVDLETCQAMGGVYLGDLIECNPNPCPPPLGACCLPDGSCSLVPQPNCPTGVWMNGFNCDPNPCPGCLLPCFSGACCLPDGTCIWILEMNCVLENGSFVGTGTSCNPNPCQTSSIPEPGMETKSWGQIKNKYR